MTPEKERTSFNPTDNSMVTKSPRIGVGPGFDSQGSVIFFLKQIRTFPTCIESIGLLPSEVTLP